MFFFFNDTATTEIYTLSLHDALPICRGSRHLARRTPRASVCPPGPAESFRPNALSQGQAHRMDLLPRPQRFDLQHEDRKSTRLNSSHANISYAVFCLKKKNKDTTTFV